MANTVKAGMTMENYTLSEAKKLFGKLYKEGRTEEAALVAKEITEKSPEAVSGYYYSLVLATDNFKTYGDAEKTQALYDLFAARADEATAKKYGDKLKALKEAPRAEKFAEKPAAAAAVKADKKGFNLFGLLLGVLCVLFAAAKRLFDGIVQGVFRTVQVLSDDRLGKRLLRFRRL